MKVKIRTDGILYLEPEGDTESYALQAWFDRWQQQLKSVEIGYLVYPRGQPQRARDMEISSMQHPSDRAPDIKPLTGNEKVDGKIRDMCDAMSQTRESLEKKLKSQILQCENLLKEIELEKLKKVAR
jgi:hypothetical protein